jgi:hypothetical protein
VAACLVCHDLKDRIFLKNWDFEAVFLTMQELFSGLLESIRGLPPEEIFAACYMDIERRWDDLSPLARVMYAKLRSIHEDRWLADTVAGASS